MDNVINLYLHRLNEAEESNKPSFSLSKVMSDITKAAKKYCEELEGDQKNLCVVRYKILAVKMYMKSLSNYKNFCKDERYPSKCRQKAVKAMQSARQEVLDLQLKETQLKRKLGYGKVQYRIKKR
jgi:hypothetical protein